MKKSLKIIFSSFVGLTLVGSIGLGLGLGLTHNNQDQKQTSIKSLNQNIHSSSQQTNKTPSSQPAVTFNNINYQINLENFSASVLGFNIKSESNLVIPNSITYKGINFAVTQINNGAFYNQQLTNVSLPNGLVSIGAFAFANNFLQTLSIPMSVQSIGDNAFSNNPFKYDSVVYLGPNCQWNKSTALCPFPSNNNYSVFCPQINFVIQNQAVYEWQADQNGWIIKSYMPSIGSVKNIDGYTLQQDKITRQDKFNNSYPQAKYRHNGGVAMANYMFSNSLATNFIKIGNYNSGFTFNTKNKTLNFITDDAPKSLTNLTGNFQFTIFNPATGQYSFNNSYSSNISAAEFMKDVNINNGLTFHYGDVISFKGTLAKDINVCTQFSSLKNLESWTTYLYGGSNSWTNNFDELNSQFMITPYGLIPYTNLVHLQPLNILGSTNNQNVNVSGFTLPNRAVSVTMNQKTYHLESNALGNFSLDIEDQSNLTPTTLLTVSVQGVQEKTYHLLGNNPVNSAVLMNLNGFQFSILFNGMTHKLNVYYQGAFNGFGKLSYPSYMNPSFLANDLPNLGSLSQTKALSRQIGSFDHNNIKNFDFVISVQKQNNSNNKTTYENIGNYTIKLTNKSTVSDLIQQVEQIPYENNYVYQINIPNSLDYLPYGNNANSSIYELVSNNAIAPMGVQENSSYVYTRFLVNRDGITNLLNTPYELSAINLVDQYYSQYYTKYEVTNHSIRIMYHYGSLESGGNVNNFYNVDQAMKNVAVALTSGLTNDYAKVLAIAKFVSDNMGYSGSYQYGHTIRGTFRHLQGLCGDYANLTAVLCALDGIVSRVVVGYADLQANQWVRSGEIDHAWTQVWLPEVHEWITVDPTWGWYAPLGQIQNRLNLSRGNEQIAVVFWPKKNGKPTNYFSYFKGYEYQALNHLSSYYNMPQGRIDAIDNLSYAMMLAKLLVNTVQIPNGSYNTYARVKNN